jgi:hypothetical protein
MSASPFSPRHFRWFFATLLVLTSVGLVGVARAQSDAMAGLPSSALPPVTASDAAPDRRRPERGPDTAPADPGVVQTGCSTCGSGLIGSLAPPADGPDGCCGGGCGAECYPGRNRSYCCCGDGDSCLGRLCGGIYHCICCPDPCYEPRWIAVQDSAFFTDSARPITQLRYRVDTGFDVDRPDRAEYFFARPRTMPNQLEPGPSDPSNPLYTAFRHGVGKGPAYIASDFDHEDFDVYMEGATERFSAFVEIPYKEIDPSTGAASVKFQQTTPPPTMDVLPPAPFTTADTSLPGGTTVQPPNGIMLPAGTVLKKDVILVNGGFTYPVSGTAQATPQPIPAQTRIPAGTALPYNTLFNPGAVTATPKINPTTVMPIVSPALNASGFGDMNFGTKAVLIDCELLLLTLQFKTYVPTGDFSKGLGNGHVSLEPALLWSLKLTPEMYLQGEFAYWIPIGGDALYQGDIYHSHISLNRTLWSPCTGIKVVGTLEGSHWVILGGNYTDPNLLVPDPRPGAPAGQLTSVAASASNEQIFSAGPGIRLFVCDKIDFGVGTQFALTSDHWEEELIRCEFRWRF